MIPKNPQSISTCVGVFLAWFGLSVSAVFPLVGGEVSGLLLQAPVILRQPQNLAVIDGDSASFVVVAFGEEPISYAWTFNGDPVGTNGPVYFRETCLLADQGGEVRVRVSNGAGVVDSAKATLRVRSGGIQYYIGPNGSATNSGRSPSAPWPLRHALEVIGPSNTMNLLPGTYPSIRLNRQAVTLRSTVKWGAKIVGSPYTHGVHVFDGVDDILVQDIHIASSYIDGVKLGGNYSTVRGCWIENAGRGHPFAKTNSNGLFTGQGVSSHNYNSTLVEGCLIEKCGMYLKFDHGIYASGTNTVIRGNVIRNNLGWGVQMYDSFGNNDNSLFHHNLVYGNGIGPLTVWTSAGFTNFVFNNTLIGDGYCLILVFGTVVLSNNILQAGAGWYPVVFVDTDTSVLGGHNLMNKAGSVDDFRLPTDRTVADPGFVDPARGLYWLKSSSAARGAAGGAAGAESWVEGSNFFGEAPTELPASDVGAFAYDPALAIDTRILHPASLSSASQPDYWLRPEAHDPSKAAFGGLVFQDDNGNGLRDSAEPLLSSRTLTLSGTTNATTLSGASGRYAVANLPPGDYLLAFEASDGDWIQTTPLGEPKTVAAGAGELVEGIEVGAVRCPTEFLRIRSVGCQADRILVEFSDRLSVESLRLATDFQFVPPLSVTNVEALPDGKSFALAVPGLDPSATYTLTTGEVRDVCNRSHRVIPVKFRCDELVLTTLQVDSNTLEVLWVQPGLLQEADLLTGPWKDVSSSGYLMLSSSNRHAFYRLVGLR